MFLVPFVTKFLVNRFGDGLKIQMIGKYLSWIILIGGILLIGLIFGYCGTRATAPPDISELENELKESREKFSAEREGLKGEIDALKSEADKLKGQIEVWKDNYVQARAETEKARTQTDEQLKRIEMLERTVEKNVPPDVANRERCKTFPDAKGC